MQTTATDVKVSDRWINERLMQRIPELDGIRGLAILLVVISHYVVMSVEGRPNWAMWLRLTSSGVDLFFVLSGFLIGGILIDSKQSPQYYQTFYRRRFCRIVPIYAVWFMLFLIGLCCTDKVSA